MTPAVAVIRATVLVEDARSEAERAEARLLRTENALAEAKRGLVQSVKDGGVGARMVMYDEVLWQVENDGSVTRVEYARESAPRCSGAAP